MEFQINWFRPHLIWVRKGEEQIFRFVKKLMYFNKLKLQANKVEVGNKKRSAWIQTFWVNLYYNITNLLEEAGLTLSLLRVINVKFPLQPHQKYYITQ